MFKGLAICIVLCVAFGVNAKVRSVWLKSPEVLNVYDYEHMENDDFLTQWMGTDIYKMSNYDKNTQPEQFSKCLYHWTYNGSRGRRDSATIFTRDRNWNWNEAQRFGMMVHDVSQLCKEGRGQDPSLPDGYGTNCYDPIKQMNILHTGTCAYFSAYMQGLWEAMGFQARRWNLGGGYHSVCEVYYNSAWHHYDLDQAGWAMDAGATHVLSLAEWAANPTYIANLSNGGPLNANSTFSLTTTRRPIYFEDMDMPGWATTEPTMWPGSQHDGQSYAFHDSYTLFHDMSYSLRQGEYIKLNWYPENNDWPSLGLYTVDGGISDAAGLSNWQSDGQMVYEPTLSNSYNDYYDGMYDDNLIQLDADGLSATGAGAYVIWAVHSAYQMASSKVEITADGTLTKQISKDIGDTWTTFTGTDVGNVKEWYDYLLKISIPVGAKLRTIKITTNIVCNPGALPRLSPAVNLTTWTRYSQAVRLYTYHQDEPLTKKASQGWDAVTRVSGPPCGVITSVSGSYEYGVPNPLVQGGQYQAAIMVGGSSIASNEVKVSDDFTAWPWVYDYVDMAAANLSIMRTPITGAKQQAAMALHRKVDYGVISSAGKGQMRMHYDVNHSSYTGAEPLIVSYNITTSNAATAETDWKPAAGTLGATYTLVDTTGSKVSGANGDYYELQFDLTGKVGANGIVNNWVKIENPGHKPFAARATTPGQGPGPGPCVFPSGNPLTSPDLYVTSTGMATYMANFTEPVIQNLRAIHCNWDPAWNKYRIATLGNSITETNAHWEPLSGNVSGVSNSSAINAFKDSTFNRNSWLSAGNCKGASHGNQSGQTIMWVANQVPTVLAGDRPMVAAIMIGTNNVRNGWSAATCQQSLDCWPDTMEYNLILNQLIDAGVIPIITTIPFINDADPGWGKAYPSDQYLVPYNNKLRALAAARNLPLIDLHQWCLDHGTPAELLADWAHPKTGCGSNVDFGTCLDGGSQGGIHNARHYLLIMAMYDIVRYVVEGQGYPYTGSQSVSVSDNSFMVSCFPNPFNPSTTLRYHIPASFHVDHAVLGIYNVKGELIKSYSVGSRAGSVVWDGRDGNGRNVTSGLYFYKLVAGNSVLQGKMILAK